MDERNGGHGTAAARQGWTGDFGDRARLHVAVGGLRQERRRSGGRADPAGDRARRRSFRQLGHVWLGPERGIARPRVEGPAGRRRDRDQIRPDPAAGRRQRRRRQPRLCRAGLRGEPEAARGRGDRPLLPAPGRPGGAGRGDGGGDGAAGRAGQGAVSRAVRGAARAHPPRPRDPSRSPRCRANFRCSTARRRPRRAS